MKRIGILLLLCMLFCMGCGRTEELEEENPDSNVELENVVENDIDNTMDNAEDKEESEGNAQDEKGAEDVVKKPERVWDESKAVKMATSANVNFRTEPNTECEVIRVLKQYTEVKAIQGEDGWAMVKYGEKTGYVREDYLMDLADIPAEPEDSQSNEEVNTLPSVPKVETIPGQHRNPNSAVVVIDPGHQGRGDSTKEPNGPGSSEMKARVTSGTAGVSTGVAEYVLNLDISLKLKTELENRGYTVYMTRTSHDVNISNMERAKYASSVGADIAVRIHANGSANSSVRGAETLVPSKANPYVSHLAAASQSLGSCIVNQYCSATGFNNRGVIASDTMTGINWSEVPVAILELGFMSNAAEDQAMQDSTMQNNMVQGIANGIDKYFGF